MPKNIGSCDMCTRPWNPTSRVRPVRSLGGFGRGAQQGAGRFRLGGTCRCLAVVRVLGPACAGAPLGFFGGFRSRTARTPRSGCLSGWYWRSRVRCANEIRTPAGPCRNSADQRGNSADQRGNSADQRQRGNPADQRGNSAEPARNLSRPAPEGEQPAANCN